MGNPLELLKGNSGQAGEGLKGLISLLSNAKSAAGAPQAAQPGQIGAELAYKLAQAVDSTSDSESLKTHLVALVDALAGIKGALSGKSGEGIWALARYSDFPDLRRPPCWGGSI